MQPWHRQTGRLQCVPPALVRICCRTESSGKEAKGSTGRLRTLMLRVRGGVLGFVRRTAGLGRFVGGRGRASGLDVVVEEDAATHVVKCVVRASAPNLEARQDRTRYRSESCLTNQVTEINSRVSALRERARKQSRDSQAIQ